MLSASRPMLVNTKADSQSFLGDQLNFCFPINSNSPISNSTPPLQTDIESETELEITLYSSSPHSNSNSNSNPHSHLLLHSQQDQEKENFSATNQITLLNLKTLYSQISIPSQVFSYQQFLPKLVLPLKLAH
ncbi:unnamed protein product [Ambrosiozyma monospora]|uniref:Unnamed protein product n=1 Tax=Ambrosiozyma monospora TaxID=43982 RepID=A0A9W7DHE5_AMBMO|nr:unnamed protein product [Ambrosiozyma monospora]